MIVRCIVFLALLVSANYGVCAETKNRVNASVPWVIADLAPPFVAQNEFGQLEGITVDYVKQVLTQANIDTEILTAPWQRIAREAKSDKNVLAFAIVRNEEREALFHWITPLVKSRHQLFGHSSSGNIEGLNALPQDATIAVLRNDYRHDLLISMNKTVLAFDTWAEVVSAFYKREATFLFASQGVIDVFCPHLEDICVPAFPVYTHSETTTYLAMSKSESSAPWVRPLVTAASRVKSSVAFQQNAQQWVSTQQQHAMHFDGNTFNLWHEER